MDLRTVEASMNFQVEMCTKDTSRTASDKEEEHTAGRTVIKYRHHHDLFQYNGMWKNDRMEGDAEIMTSDG